MLLSGVLFFVKMQNIKDLTLKEFEDYLFSVGEKPFHAKQIISWIYSRGITSFDEMTDISKGLREKVKKEFYISIPEIAAVEVSPDGTKKILLRLYDGNCIECVLMPEEKRLTLCISTQVGCSLDCRFCLTGKMGFVRNLKVSEMTDQVFACKSSLPDNQKITNVVLMGMGEPLLNYNEIIKLSITFSQPAWYSNSEYHAFF